MDNRDLYLAVADLVARNAGNGRSLEDFLRVLRAALEPHHAEPAITPAQFVAALDAAFSGPVAERDAGWRLEDLSGDDDSLADAAAVDRILKCQVLDMEDAEASGALRDENRGFGRSVGRPEARARRGRSPHRRGDQVGAGGGDRVSRRRALQLVVGAGRRVPLVRPELRVGT